MSGISKPINSLIEDTEFQWRAIAFLIASAATFVLLCSLWPLTVRGFRSTAALVVDGAVLKTDAEMEAELKAAVLAETSDDGLATIINEIEQSGNLKSKQIEYRDYQTIRESIRIGHFNDSKGQRFEIAFQGDGGKDERQLVDVLMQRVSKRMHIDSGMVGNPKLAEQFEQAEWIVEQMEGDLNFVKAGLAKLGTDSSGELSLEQTSDLEAQGTSNFQFASSKKVVSPTASDLKGSIDSIDVENLRNLLDGLKEETASNKPTPKSNGANFQLPKPTKTLPINGVPSVPFLMLLGGFAGLVGTVVAWNFKPFASRGFTDVASIRRKLKVPVIATLELTEVESESDEDEGRPVANRIVDYASLFLLGVFIIILGFVIINADVREAFFENPFFGCAKIVRIFTGH